MSSFTLQWPSSANNMTTTYWQLFGFQKHLEELPRALVHPAGQQNEDGVDVVLGIRPNGASYLLVPDIRYYNLRLSRPRVRSSPWPGDCFISLSPIHFPSMAALDEKKKSYDSNKKDKRGPRDRSKANTTFTSLGDGLSKEGIERASFEHQRILYHLYRGEIYDPREFALATLSWMNDARFIAFAFNTWSVDSRDYSERERDPKLLDIGVTEFPPPSGSHEFVARSSVHLVNNENRFLNNPGKRRIPFESGESKIVERLEIATRVRELLLPSGSSRTPSRVLLFVHDEQRSLALLRALGIDTSQWTSGLMSLLYGKDFSGKPERDRYDDRRVSDPRSRSPRRNGDPRPRPRSRSPRSQASLRVHIIDVRQLYCVLKQVAPLVDTVRSNASELGVRDIMGINESDGTFKMANDMNNGLCAGSESRLLGYMWHSMACGSPIDDQRMLRWHSKLSETVEDHATEESTSNANARDSDDEEEMDPNDMFQSVAPTPSGSSAPAKKSSLSILEPGGWEDESDDDE